MNGDTTDIIFHLLVFLYELFKIKLTLFTRVHIMSLSLGSFMTDYLVQSISNLHLMMRSSKGVFLLFWGVDHMLLILLL